MNVPLLSSVQNPEDLKKIPIESLPKLAEEIRQRIIETMSVNGGHLASNLGAIELTIALHYVFDSPEDKLIWDVSHQTYTHKLLTGRQDLFHRIRQFKGLCGFSHPKESPYDHFHAGHAGTALSLALGVAKNRDLSQRQEYVIPIIGDATLTCGMSLEALNNVSRDLKRFIVILNDNAMSISKNVGAITRILSRMLSNPTMNKLHQDLDAVMSKIPSLGTILSKQGHKFTESLKHLFSPAAFFEQYGLSYIGPIDGHDIKGMIESLKSLKNSNWPVILHVLTHKGQGMDVAIQNPVTYHGAKPFCKETGKFISSHAPKPTFPNIFGHHILQMAEKDQSIVAVTPAMSAGSCLDPFMKAFPERCFDVGIAESHSLTFCGGLSYGKNLKVVASIYSTFLQRAFDNLFHDICLQELPVVLAIDRAGISAPDGSTHHGIYDISFLKSMPNMIITQPRDGHLLKELLESSFSWGHPTAIRYPNLATEVKDKPLMYRELGKGEILAHGEDLIIIALGHMNQTALKVRDLLAKEGISVSVVDPIFVKPLDQELLEELFSKIQRIVTLEEHAVISGLGSSINHFVIHNGYQNLSILNLGIPEIFVDHGSHGDLMDQLGLTPEKISKKILAHFSFEPSNPSLNLNESVFTTEITEITECFKTSL